MATTKKSPKAKTNTASARASSRSAAQVKRPPAKQVRTVKRTVSAKAAPAKKTPIRAKASRAGNVLRQLYVVSSVVSLGLAAAAALLMNTKAYQLFTGLLTKDELASQTNTVFVSAVHSVYDLELRWAVVGIMLVSTLFALLYLVRNGREENRLHFLRWLETGIVSGLMVEVVALLSGIQDIMTLKVIGAVVVISSLLRWVAERQQAEVSGSRKSTSVLSILTCLIPGALIASYALATWVYGMVRTPWYVYALYAVLVASFLAYVANLRLSVSKGQTSLVTQRNYVTIGLVTRIAFATILIYGLHK